MLHTCICSPLFRQEIKFLDFLLYPPYQNLYIYMYGYRRYSVLSVNRYYTNFLDNVQYISMYFDITNTRIWVCGFCNIILQSINTQQHNTVNYSFLVSKAIVISSHNSSTTVAYKWHNIYFVRNWKMNADKSRLYGLECCWFWRERFQASTGSTNCLDNSYYEKENLNLTINLPFLLSNI